MGIKTGSRVGVCQIVIIFSANPTEPSIGKSPDFNKPDSVTTRDHTAVEDTQIIPIFICILQTNSMQKLTLFCFYVGLIDMKLYDIIPIIIQMKTWITNILSRKKHFFKVVLQKDKYLIRWSTHKDPYINKRINNYHCPQ